MFLLFFIFVHLAVEHLTPLSLETIQRRLTTAEWKFIDGILLLLAVSHGLNGLWQIGQDYLQSKTFRNAFKFTLWGLGALLTAVGLEVLFR